MKKEMLATPNGEQRKGGAHLTQSAPHPACGHLLPSAEKGCEALLTQEDVGARLQVTVRTVVRLQNDGVLPFILLGKAVRFYWPTVIAHLNAHFTVCKGQTLKPRMHMDAHGLFATAPTSDAEVQNARSAEVLTANDTKYAKGNSDKPTLPHPGPLPPAAAGRRGSLYARGGRP